MMAKTREQKRLEAEARNAAFQALTVEEKREKIANSPGNSVRQLKRLARKS